MKKKGFTLVELLAVIAILAILVIIALPNVLEMFNNAKKNTFVTEIESIYKQAQTDFINDSLSSSGAKTYCASGSNSGFTVTCTTDNKEHPLQLTTTKAYYISMTSDGTVTHIGVADKSFVYGAGSATAPVKAITEINAKNVWDASNSTNGKDHFDIKTTITPAQS